MLAVRLHVDEEASTAGREALPRDGTQVSTDPRHGFAAGSSFALAPMPVSLADSLIFSAFPWVAAHLDLHSSRIMTCTSLREYEQGEFFVQGVETFGQHARAGDPGRDPEVSDQHQRVAETDPSRLELRAFGDTLHFEADEILADGQSPEFLDDFLLC